MRAVVFTETGGPEVLRLVDRDVPEPAEGEVRVRIRVSGVNPTDWKQRSGATAARDDLAERVPNQDGAGEVDALGLDAEGLAVGQRVWVWEAAQQRLGGTAQELVVVPQRHVVPLPDGVSYDVGASLGVPALTAHRLLTVHEDGPTRLGPNALKDRVVLVAGGAGAVGHATIQLARWAGATVVTTVSGPEKGELARRAGAHHVVDYRAQDAVAAIRAVAPGGVDLVAEVAPGPNAELDAAVVAPHATIAVYANNGGDTMTIPVRAHMGPNTRYQFVLLYTVPDPAKTAAVEDVSAALAAGALPVGEDAGLPLHRFPLERTGDAHAAVEAGAVGKVLVDLG